MLTPFRHVRILTLSCGVILAAASAAAQPSIERTPASAADVATLQQQLVQLREEVGALRALLADVQQALAKPPGSLGRSGSGELGSSGDTAAIPPAAQQPPTLQAPQVTPEMLELLKAQIDEHAQTKIESASRMPVKLSGTILTNTYVNSGEANWLENPNWVSAPPTASEPRGSMSATARQTRVGLETAGITIGGWQASGTLIADFLGGTPGFRTGSVMGLPRLIYAFGRLETDRTAIEIGQDHVLLAPRDPTSLAAFSFPLLFRSGNLYLRAPQARVERKLTSGWTAAMGIVAPTAGDAASVYEFSPPAGAGERSMRPALQARLGFARGTAETGRELAAGASGHYGWRRTGSVTSDAWAAALDLNVRVGRVGAAGEWYAADNAEAFGGGIAQPGRAFGGWAEGRLTMTSRATMTAGFGRDSPKDAAGRVLRLRNRTAFSSLIFQLTPEVATSIEYRWMETRFGLVPVSAENHHLNAVFAVKF